MTALEIDLKRIYKGSGYTIGKLRLDGVYFCDVLEDTVREFGSHGEGKIPGNTAIPYGRYEVELTMSARFGRILPHLINVPFFEGIRIHPGNDAVDTHGCILVGRNTVPGKVLDSKATFESLMPHLEEALAKGIKIFITVH